MVAPGIVCGDSNQMPVTLTPGEQQIVIDAVLAGKSGHAGTGLQRLLNEVDFELLKRTVLSERCWQEPLVLHADNGAPMKSQVLQVKLAELKITPSHSRPRVSNDNAHVESLFRTLKYVPAWPEKGFATLEEARAWVETFVVWYNEAHRHSGIPVGRQQEIHRIACGVDRPVEVFPLAFDSDIRFVHSPPATDGAFMPAKRLI